MDKIKIVKTTLNTAAQIGAGTIVYGIVRTNVVPGNIIAKVCLPVATFAAGGAAAKVLGNEMDRFVDGIVDAFKDNQTKIDTVTE